MTREQEEVLAFAAEWYELATGTRRVPDNAYLRFMALWIAFNGLCAATFPKAQSDSAQMKSFGSWAKARDAHHAALAVNQYGSAVGVLKERGVYNYRERKTEVLTDAHDVAEVIALMYRVRCNLFHARKVPANLRDRGLVDAAYVIVQELVKRLVWPHAEARAV